MSITAYYKDERNNIQEQECDFTEEGEHGIKLQDRGDSPGSRNQVGYIPYDNLQYVLPSDER